MTHTWNVLFLYQCSQKYSNEFTLFGGCRAHFNFAQKHQILYLQQFCKLHHYLLIYYLSITMPNQHTLLFIRADCTVKSHKYVCKYADCIINSCANTPLTEILHYTISANNRCGLVLYIFNLHVIHFCKSRYTQDEFHLCIYRLTQMSYKTATWLGALWKVNCRSNRSANTVDILSGVWPQR